MSKCSIACLVFAVILMVVNALIICLHFIEGLDGFPFDDVGITSMCCVVLAVCAVRYHHAGQIAARATANSAATVHEIEIVNDVKLLHESECAICLIRFVNGDAVGKLLCHHVFHSACLREWNKGCPFRCEQSSISDRNDPSTLTMTPVTTTAAGRSLALTDVELNV